MSRFIDLTGLRFGRLIVVREEEKDKFGHTKWLCRCDCGQEKIIYGNSLRQGSTKSCGCLSIEITVKRNLKHGHSKRSGYSKTYRVWDHMIQRCNNSNCKAYEDYGGRGIGVCARWDISQGGSFENFLNDVGEQPGKGYSIDRVNNNGDYSPNNWKWSTNKEQMRNTRRNRTEIFNGKNQCRTDWAKEYRMSTSALIQRLDKLGWTIEKALTTPVRKKRTKK